MSFGLQFTNASDVVTLDSEYARLCVLCSGRFSPTQESGLGSVTVFPSVITSTEPPLIFVRPDTVNAIAGLCLAAVYGSPGAWTGFYIRAYNKNSAQPNGRYFAAAFMAFPIADFGMRLWGASSQVVFDSGTPSALFTRAFQNWKYVKSTFSSPNYFNYYSVDFDFPADEFIMINNFSMLMVGGSGAGRMLYSWWDFPSNKLWAVTSSTANPYAFYLPALFAKMNG